MAGHPSIYEKTEDTEYKELILDLAKTSKTLRTAAARICDTEGPLHVTTIFHMPTPNYRKVKVRTAEEEDCKFLAEKKPDVDNLEKAVLDAVEGFLWENDGRVASKYSLKTYTTEDKDPRIEVHVRKMSYWMEYGFLESIVRLFSGTKDTVAVDGNGNPLDGEVLDQGKAVGKPQGAGPEETKETA